MITLDRPFIMGVVNVTPDSFYDGSRFNDVDAASRKIHSLLEEGADIIDIGGMSSRPGASILTVEEELQRVLPVIRDLNEEYPDVLVSIDTIHAEVARQAVENGAAMVNDISGGANDPQMLTTVATLNVPYIAMHMKGRPKTMQDNVHYEDVAVEVLDYFITKVRECHKAGITDIIIDPGLGFGKSLMNNYDLLDRLEIFKILELPILIGASRKSMIYKLLDITPEEALNGTTAVNMFALSKGASILRVHDVKAARECLKIFQAISHSSVV